jgi:hypothetical protein
VNYHSIIKKAWAGYDNSKVIRDIEDISAMVSTNHVYHITFEDDDIIIAKLSKYGKYEHFKEDHRIIHALSNNLLYPFENFIARSLLKNNRVYTYRHKYKKEDAWVVFYNPVRIDQRLPRRLEEHHIRALGKQMAKFHRACFRINNVLPKSSKTLGTDIRILIEQLEKTPEKFGTPEQVTMLRQHCDVFMKNRTKYNAVGSLGTIPVFIDWNIGNFSINDKVQLYSRWDYDWFRMSSRMMDFYFLSRVVSNAGDRTVFSYVIGPLMEDRFLIFLEEYHKTYPLTAHEIHFMKDAYRFFILNYVIKDGRYFFNEQYAKKLRAEALSIYLPSIEKEFNAEKIINALGINTPELAH